MMNGGGGGKEEMLQTFQTKIGQNMDFDLPPYQEHDELAKTFPDEQFHEEVCKFIFTKKFREIDFTNKIIINNAYDLF